MWKVSQALYNTHVVPTTQQSKVLVGIGGTLGIVSGWNRIANHTAAGHRFLE
jgi:hypothetical protein